MDLGPPPHPLGAGAVSASRRRGDTLAEILAFPAGRHDDEVNSTAQALAWAKQKPKLAGAEGVDRVLSDAGGEVGTVLWS